MLGAEAVLPHFRTNDIARANSQASFAAGAADPNTYCGHPCARTAQYLPLMKGIPADNLVVQPQNRGTAAAILYALRRLSELNPCASVAVFPSDHFVHNDDVFMAHVDLAFHSVSERPGLILLLGMTPDRAESAYGWIEPDEPIGLGGEVARVRRSWEKPPPQVALQLWKHGCLWNTFVMIGKFTTFITLTIRALPTLASAFFETVRTGRRAENQRRAEEALCVPAG